MSIITTQTLMPKWDTDNNTATNEIYWAVFAVCYAK